MAALSANPAVPTKTQRRDTTKTFVIKTSEVIYDSGLVGVDSNGDLVAWADTAGHKFVGIVEGGATTGNDAASPATRATVRIDGPVLFGVDVAGVTDRNSIGALVYCTTDNVADLTLTATTNTKAIGRLIDWRSNTDMDVELFTPVEYLSQPLVGDITALTENSTTIGGTQNNNFDTLSLAWDSSTYPTAAEATLLIDAIRECAKKINEIISDLNIN